MANTSGEKELKTEWPVIEGLEADEKHEGREINLVPEESNLTTSSQNFGML